MNLKFWVGSEIASVSHRASEVCKLNSSGLSVNRVVKKVPEPFFFCFFATNYSVPGLIYSEQWWAGKLPTITFRPVWQEVRMTCRKIMNLIWFWTGCENNVQILTVENCKQCLNWTRVVHLWCWVFITEQWKVPTGAVFLYSIGIDIEEQWADELPTWAEKLPMITLHPVW